jgi:hypothetical protein
LQLAWSFFRLLRSRLEGLPEERRRRQGALLSDWTSAGGQATCGRFLEPELETDPALALLNLAAYAAALAVARYVDDNVLAELSRLRRLAARAKTR